MGKPHSAEASPDIPLAIHEDAFDRVLREAVKVRRIMAITNESPVVAVEFEQTSAVRSKPERAVPVFEHCGYACQGRARLILLVKRIVRQRVGLPVEHRQRVAGHVKKPEHAEQILVE